MTKEELKSFVCAKFSLGEDKWFDYEEEFVALAEIVAANEREACASVCDDHAYSANGEAAKSAKTIRARGKA